MPTNFLALEDVLWIHDEVVIKEFGGSYGVLSLASLESAVETPQQTMFDEELYPDLISKAGMLFYLLVKNHCFIDGNKRTATLSLIEFLERNACTVEATQNELVQFALAVATSALDKEATITWVREHLQAIS